jgi:hypothetical protein
VDEGFDSRQLPAVPDAAAPDGSDVRVLLELRRGSMAHFQFRADGDGPLAAVGVTMPPWPGDHEAYHVPGPWPAGP